MAGGNFLKSKINDSKNKINSNENNQIQEEISFDEQLIIKEIRSAVIDRFNQKLLTEKNDIQFQANVRDFISNLIDIKITGIKMMKKNQLLNNIYNDIIGFGPIQPLLDNKDITEIMVSRYDRVFVEKNGIMVLQENIKFDSEEHLMNTINKIVQPMGKTIDEANPICDTSLPDGSRVNCTIPPISPDSPTLTIRKFSEKNKTEQDYLNLGSLNEEMLFFIKQAVEGKCNIVVAGGTGTGKTTLLNLTSNFIPEHEAIVTIEDTLELQLKKTNVRRLLTRDAVNGSGIVTTQNLVKETLRQRADRVIVGEIRDGSIYDMLDSMGSGQEGGQGTIHAKSPRHLIDVRIPILMGMSNMDISLTTQQLMIADAIDLIIYIKRFRDGSRKITNITEVVGFGKEIGQSMGIKNAQDKIYLNDIFKYKAGPIINKKQTGEFIKTGYVPKRIINKTSLYGVNIDEEFFSVKNNKEDKK